MMGSSGSSENGAPSRPLAVHTMQQGPPPLMVDGFAPLALAIDGFASLALAIDSFAPLALRGGGWTLAWHCGVVARVAGALRCRLAGVVRFSTVRHWRKPAASML